ncbi:hypothetical protein [Streptomyces ginkgonis]|uniref:hypothetical protein n=1 Tax=Streptomyces ginkgonis TaxID=1812259 RepID=UPI002176C712|nr:hypothetical protein [Streptomyces ginkgonis]
MIPCGDSDEHVVIRRLAVWVLLERSEQALSKGPRTLENSVEGGRLSGRPPAPAPCPAELEGDQQRAEAIDELSFLLRRELNKKTTPEETRRIAETLEYLDMDEDSLPWWEMAARRGDKDARDYLEVLLSESRAVDEGSKGSLYRYLQEPLAIPALGSLKPERDWIAALNIALDISGTLVQSSEARELVREIEEYLAHPDRVTDRRCP